MKRKADKQVLKDQRKIRRKKQRKFWKSRDSFERPEKVVKKNRERFGRPEKVLKDQRKL